MTPPAETRPSRASRTTRTTRTTRAGRTSSSAASSPAGGATGGARGDATGDAAEPNIHLVRGDDPSLTAQATRTLVDRLVGERDPALVVEEHGTAEELDVGAVVDACTTPPFLVDRRVVIVRDAGRLNAADAARLDDVIHAPLPEVHLVLVAGGGTMPQALVKAVSAAGGVVDAAAGRGRDRDLWVAQRIREGPVSLDAAAARRLEAHLGEDLGRLAGMLETLAASFGAGATISEDDLEPFLGEAGAVPPWELTDAIDAGDVAGALSSLRRMLTAGGRHPLAVMASIQTHFSNLLRLDGAQVSSVADAAALIGTRSDFVARKALARARDFGSERIAHAVTYLADADLDLKGRTALPGDVVLEILVARLARLTRSRPSATGTSRGGRSASSKPVGSRR